jgi:hypothetical protein
VATKWVTRKPAHKRSANPDATINTLVILVVIVMVLGGLFLYAQNKKQFALWPSIMEAIANLPAPPLAAVIGDPESTGSVQPSQPASQIEVPRPASSIEAPRPTSAIEALQSTSVAEAPSPAPSIETSQSTRDSQTSQPDARPGTAQTTGSFQAPKPQARAGAPEATGSVQSAKRRVAAARKVRKPAPKVEPPQPVSDTVAARSPNID